MTLIEMMVSVAIGSLLLAVLASFIVYSARSFATMANYADLEYDSRNALDQMTYRIRQAQRLKSYKPNQELVFDDAVAAPFNGQKLTFNYVGAPTYGLYMTNAQYIAGVCLLTNCTAFNFELKQRNLYSSSYENFPPLGGDPTQCKVVQIFWKTARNLWGTTITNTEVVQTAKIVIRDNDAKNFGVSF